MHKKLAIAFLLIIVVFAQCTTKKNKVVNQNGLPSVYFTINVNADTTLHTAKGAIIKIPKGALLPANNSPTVRLEIKEAYTIADMILARLTTKAGKEILSSGGMIYIQAADGDKVTVAKPISISIPTSYQRAGMQLYKGNTREDSSIDWTNPQNLPTQALSTNLNRGKMLFSNNCAACHNPIKDATGPALAFLDKRRDWDWLKKFVHNPSELIASHDRLANCIYERFNRTAMTSFPAMSDEDIHLIFKYVDYAAPQADSNLIPDFKKSFDSCQVYNKLIAKLTQQRQQLVQQNGRQAVIEHYRIDTYYANNTPYLDTEIEITGHSYTPPPNAVVPADNDANYYQFTIQEFGWYNIDILLHNLPGFENSNLIVHVTGEYRTDINIYLIIPDYKILLAGGPTAGKTDEYAFFTNEGAIPLPQNTIAYILAMGEHQEQVYFGKTVLITSLQQTPGLQLNATTKEQMNTAIKALDIPDLNINAYDTKNADSLRKIDAQLKNFEYLKPKNCDCNCGARPVADSGYVK